MFNAIQFKYYIEKGIHGRWVNETQCMGCGSCVLTCPTGALSMKLVDPPESLQGYHQQPLENTWKENDKMLDYTNTTPELLNEVNAIFNKEIDPIFMDLA